MNLNLDNKTKKWVLALSGAIILLIGGNTYLFLTKSKQEKVLKEVKVQNKELEVELAELKLEYEVVRVAAAAMDEAFQERERELYAQIQQLEAKLRKGTLNRSDISGTKQEVSALNVQIQEYKAQIVQLQSDNSNLESQNSTLEATIAETNAINKRLSDENVELQKRVSGATALKTSSVSLKTYKRKGKGNDFVPVDKAKEVNKVVAEMKIVSNDLAPVGQHTVFMQVLNPGLDVMASPKSDTSEELIVDGKRISYTTSTVIMYNPKMNTYIMEWINSENWRPGNYTVNLYTKEGNLGSATFTLKK